jgi:hypothetical protein
LLPEIKAYMAKATWVFIGLPARLRFSGWLTPVPNGSTSSKESGKVFKHSEGLVASLEMFKTRPCCLLQQPRAAFQVNSGGLKKLTTECRRHRIKDMGVWMQADVP